MYLAPSAMISEIDKYCAEDLNIPVYTLMERAGCAVARVVRDEIPTGGRVVILAGKGNNGGDGYATACALFADYEVTVFDVFSAGQKTQDGKAFLEKFKSMGGRVENLTINEQTKLYISSADCIVDAIFGTGFHGTPPTLIDNLAKLVVACPGKKIAIDVPLGVNADNGSVSDDAVVGMDVTVALSFIKPGLVSFPARAYVGRVVYDDIGIPKQPILEKFNFKYRYIDGAVASAMLPARPDNSNKGSFGKLLVITGSAKYRGAAHLSLEAALRGGVGYVTYVGTPELCQELSVKFPEVIYKQMADVSAQSMEDIEKIAELSSNSSATLIGCGSDASEGLYALLCRLLSAEGGPIVVDADAVNALAQHREESLSLIKNAKRRVILTPHPLEFARLSGNAVSFVQLHRIEAAEKFAAELRCLLVLKGAGTVVTDGSEVLINSSGSSALAKAGSGDVLAGLIASVVASGAPVLDGAALSVYYHGRAADALAREFSVLGVTPSDLPREIARQIAKEQ